MAPSRVWTQFQRLRNWCNLSHVSRTLRSGHGCASLIEVGNEHLEIRDRPLRLSDLDRIGSYVVPGDGPETAVR
jgi:hypothetical protein